MTTELQEHFDAELNNSYAQLVLGDVDDFDTMLGRWKGLPHRAKLDWRAKELFKATPHLDYLALLYVAEMVGLTILEHATKFESLTTLTTTFLDSPDEDEDGVPFYVHFEQFNKAWGQLYTKSVHRRARKWRGPNKPKYVSHHLAMASTFVCSDLLERYAPNIITPSIFAILPSDKKRLDLMYLLIRV